jgi:hypothetical protein
MDAGNYGFTHEIFTKPLEISYNPASFDLKRDQPLEIATVLRMDIRFEGDAQFEFLQPFLLDVPQWGIHSVS